MAKRTPTLPSVNAASVPPSPELVAAVRSGRRIGRTAIAAVASLGTLAHVARGGFSPPVPSALDIALVALGITAIAARARALPAVRADTTAPIDAGIALVGLSLADALVAATGGPAGPLAALPVVTVAVAVALSDPKRAWALVLATLVGEVALHFAHTPERPLWTLGLRAIVVVAASAIHHGLTRAEIARVRRHAERMITDERQRQQEAAHSFRLAAAANETAKRTPQDDETRLRASLDEIHASLVGLLNLIRRTMGLHTCALFWTDVKGRSVRLVEAATADEAELQENPMPVGTGAMGGAISLGKPVFLSHLRAEYAGLTYYRGPHAVKTFGAVPIVAEDTVRGVLVADRTDDRPFTAEEQTTLETAALQARRLIDNERVFARLERAKDDLGRLFQAARALGEALTEDQVVTAVAASARAIVDHDLLALTAFDQKAKEHRIRHAEGDLCPAGLAGTTFHENSGLVSAAVKARHALPYKGQFDPKTQFLFTRDKSLAECASVLTLPLVVRDSVIGTLTLGSRRKNGFSEGTRQMLGVLAAHASIAISNAAAVRRLEELATTDPMTGLFNKRSLEHEFDQRLRASARFGRPLSAIVLDIDRFKSVNDTYGHATGDVVIKGLGAVLTRCRRETDAVGRFGGEEFVVVCEETETAGAILLAERIREEFARQVFQTDHGPLSCTCSLGIAEFPRDANDRGGLFKRADEALYQAKQNGRNQTRTASPPAANPGRKSARTTKTAGPAEPGRAA